MTAMIIVNVVISVLGVALVAGVMRFGYLIGGGAFERRARVAELRTVSRDLERAA
jgi:KaiC/GvpD/RAD55 family RecA-like ATPase